MWISRIKLKNGVALCFFAIGNLIASQSLDSLGASENVDANSCAQYLTNSNLVVQDSCRLIETQRLDSLKNTESFYEKYKVCMQDNSNFLRVLEHCKKMKSKDDFANELLQKIKHSKDNRKGLECKLAFESLFLDELRFEYMPINIADTAYSICSDWIEIDRNYYIIKWRDNKNQLWQKYYSDSERSTWIWYKGAFQAHGIKYNFEGCQDYECNTYWQFGKCQWIKVYDENHQLKEEALCDSEGWSHGIRKYYSESGKLVDKQCFIHGEQRPLKFCK